jgi:hypothetical protein
VVARIAKCAAKCAGALAVAAAVRNVAKIASKLSVLGWAEAFAQGALAVAGMSAGR